MILRRIHITHFFLIAAMAMLIVFPKVTRAQVNPQDYNYPENQRPWYTISSKHFLIHFQKGNSRSAQVVSRVAEEVYGPITQLYHHEPNTKISIILHDREDYSNGASYFFDNMIDIWVPALDMPLRGTHDWYRNVISHEFTHMIQLQSAMKRKRSVPAIYFQWLTYENIRRPDVLYGYPDGIITFPFASISVPSWMAEGTAQFQREGLHYDFWDTHRDMVLRTRIMDHTQLSLGKMGTFTSKTSIEREVVYNQGFALTRYLAHRFGEDVLYKISRALAKKGVNDVAKAMKMATGIDGNVIYKQWVDSLHMEYQQALSPLKFTRSTPVESKGFYDLNPVFSPDGKTLAYLSNKGQDTYEVKLYFHNLKTDKTVLAFRNASPFSKSTNNTYSDGTLIRPELKIESSAYSYSPDGKKIAYSRLTLNKYGEDYKDIFIYDLQTRKSTRITHSKRITEPAWSPDGKQIAAVIEGDATINLALLNVKDKSIKLLTHFQNGQQVYHPAWSKNGKYIYYSESDTARRKIYKLDIATDTSSRILGDGIYNYRDPEMGPEGKYLYYSSDKTGIFNIYRMNMETGKSRQLTSVHGGAFFPTVNKSGDLSYSEYKASGYKISMAKIPDLLAMDSLGTYVRPALADTFHVKAAYTHLNKFNDNDLNQFSSKIMAEADTGSYHFSIKTRGEPNQRTLYSYKDVFTNFSFYPVIRFDNYARPEGANGPLLTGGKVGKLAENLWRDNKIGFYMSSHDVLNKFSIFGGALFGFGSLSSNGITDFLSPSRLSNLDRDLFLTVDYDGLPFIKRRWSPDISVELYNMRRNVKNGLSVTDYPCVSCLPDTQKVDIAYNIWEADVYLRSKINNWSLLELGASYSPYKVSNSSFYSKEYKSTVSGTSSRYYIGTGLTAAYIFRLNEPYRNDDIAPIGIKGQVRLNYQPSKLLDKYQLKDGLLSPEYKNYENKSAEANVKYGFHALGETIELKSRFFTYFNNPSDYFFLDYIGGLTGMRSYPYFAIGGTTTAYAEMSYIFPVITNLNKQYGRFTLDKIFTRLFIETGNGWGGPLNIGNNLKTGIGAELRVSLNTNYFFPSRFFISGAYGLNKFGVHLPSEFITDTGSNRVSYGKSILIHFGLLFDFDM